MNIRPLNLVDVLDLHAGASPDKTAFKYVGRQVGSMETLTFSELSDATKLLATRLLSGTADTPKKAVLLYPQSLDFVVAFMACLRAGIVAVPLSLPINRQDQTRLLAVLDDCDPELILTLSSIQEMPESQMLMQLRPQMRWVATDMELKGATLPLASAGKALAQNTLAFLQYTSGSTGMPKGVMVSNANIVENQRMIAEGFGMSSEEVLVSWLPLFHDMGLIGCILQPIFSGQSCYLMSPYDFLQKPLRWLQAISEYGATVSGGPNFAYELCLRKINDDDLRSLDLSRWRVAFNGAEPVRASTLQQFSEKFRPANFRHQAHFPCYGLAEGTLFVSGGPWREPPHVLTVDPVQLEAHRAVPPQANMPSQDLVGSGVVPSGLKVVIADPDSGLPLAQGSVGEVWVSGPSVAIGYWNKEQATCETFHAQLVSDDRNYLRTGDLGFLNEAGQLVITGRIKDLIILRGKNYYPHDIELIVEKSHPAVRTGSSAVFVVEEDKGVWVLAEIRKDAMDSVKFAEIKAAIRSQVAEHSGLNVHGITLLEPGKVSKTTSGKIRRQDCKARLVQGKLNDLADAKVA